MSRSGLACRSLPCPISPQDRVDFFPSLGPGLLLSLTRTQVSTERTGCSVLRPALELPPQGPDPQPTRTSCLVRWRPVCVRFPSPHRLGDAVLSASPSHFRATAGCTPPPPASRVLGPSTLYGRRGPRTPESVVAGLSRSLCNIILLVYLPSPPDLPGHRRTVLFGPC